MQHDWFRGVDWQTIHQQPAPYAPHQAESMLESMEALRWVESGSSECSALVKILTANFDCCCSEASHTHSPVSTATATASGSSRESSRFRMDEKDPFCGYSFKKEKV